jgi:hypothetical protein
MNEKNKNNLLIINCKCGAELLLVPDLKSMNEAIENHVAEHVANMLPIKNAPQQKMQTKFETA